MGKFEKKIIATGTFRESWSRPCIYTRERTRYCNIVTVFDADYGDGVRRYCDIERGIESDDPKLRSIRKVRGGSVSGDPAKVRYWLQRIESQEVK